MKADEQGDLPKDLFQARIRFQTWRSQRPIGSQVSQLLCGQGKGADKKIRGQEVGASSESRHQKNETKVCQILVAITLHSCNSDWATVSSKCAQMLAGCTGPDKSNHRLAGPAQIVNQLASFNGPGMTFRALCFYPSSSW